MMILSALALVLLAGCPLVTSEEWEAANDRDGDGYLASVNGGTDCDDSDAGISPAAEEYCDGRDNDCDGETDEADAVDAPLWYEDADGDGFGAGEGAPACSAPGSRVGTDTDCDDGDSSVHPDASEVCGNGVDDDCDGTSNHCGWEGDYGLDEATALLRGEGGGNLGDWAGKGLAGSVDLDGDGLHDLLVGAPYRDDGSAQNTGAVYVVLGPVTGEQDLSVAVAALYGESSGDCAGWDVDMAADADGDGAADLLVGAPYRDAGTTGAGTAYRVPVASSPGTLGDLGDAGAWIEGDRASHSLGYAVATGGDVDGDGLDDLLVGAPGDDTAAAGAGAAFLFRGTSTGSLSPGDAVAALYGLHNQDAAGNEVDLPGDLDGDGLADLAVGASNAYVEGDRRGQAYVFLGPVTGALDLDDGDAVLTGAEEDDHAGQSIDGAGDLDADGYTDLLVSAPAATRSGEARGVVFLVQGPVTGEILLEGTQGEFVGDADEDWTGWSLAGVGDVDADGRDDVLIGAPERDAAATDAGAAYLLLGPWSGSVVSSDARAVFDGESLGDYAGGRVAAAGDVGGDGYRDLLVGAYGYKSTGSLEDGAAYLVAGAGL